MKIVLPIVFVSFSLHNNLYRLANPAMQSWQHYSLIIVSSLIWHIFELVASLLHYLQLSKQAGRTREANSLVLNQMLT
jgi:hypothetical protein